MESEKGLVLLDFKVSMFGMRVRIALAEKNLPYRYQEEDLLNNKSDLLLRSNPIHKKIPVLLDDAKPICESSIILQYIDEKWNQPNPLLPSHDPYLRAQARFWVDFIDKNIYQSSRQLWLGKPDEAEEGKKALLGHLKVLEGELGDKPFFGVDNKFGMVDVCLIPFSTWFYSWEKVGGFSMEQHFPKLMAWVERCKQRDTVAKSLGNHLEVYELFYGLRKKLGLDA